MRVVMLFASLLALLAATQAEATCNPQFSVHNQAVNVVGVALGNGNVAIERFNVRVVNAGGDECAVQLRISRATSGDPTLMPYLLLSGGRQINIAPSELSSVASSDIAVNALSGGGGSPVPFELRLPTEWGLRAGDQLDRLQVSIIGADGSVVDRLNLNVNIRIPAAVALAFVGATGGGTGPAQINLGTLSSSQITRSQPFGARVWSTSPYSVSFQSENHGSLARTGGGDSIPYELTMDSRLVDLSAGLARFAFAQHTTAEGDFHRLGITVMPVHALAGSYSDRLTVSVTAL